jgi:hypothetical protein
MQVLFLDIDGVLNDNRECENGHCAIDLRCVRRLNEILGRAPELQIVVSSDWREWVHAGHMQLSGLERLLLTHAVACEKRVAGITQPDEGTPCFPPRDAADFQFRFHQIESWLRANRPEQFVVLDDNPIPNLGGRLVQTNGSIGLTDKDVQGVLAMLSR